jgi:hypothetical protein
VTTTPVRCRACGHVLRDGTSRARQLGPTCLRRLRQHFEQLTIPTPPAFPRRVRGRLVEDVPLPDFDDPTNDES